MLQCRAMYESIVPAGGILQALVIWAYATVGERLDDACLSALRVTAKKQLQHFTLHALINTLWSLCILQVCQAADLTWLPTGMCCSCERGWCRDLRSGLPGSCFLDTPACLSFPVIAIPNPHPQTLNPGWCAAAALRPGVLAQHYGCTRHAGAARQGTAAGVE